MCTLNGAMAVAIVLWFSVKKDSIRRSNEASRKVQMLPQTVLKGIIPFFKCISMNVVLVPLKWSFLLARLAALCDIELLSIYTASYVCSLIARRYILISRRSGASYLQEDHS